LKLEAKRKKDEREKRETELKLNKKIVREQKDKADKEERRGWFQILSRKDAETKLIFKNKEAKDKIDAEKLKNRLHKAKDSAKKILTPMPTLATDLPAYFEAVERKFSNFAN